jgi:hypothetical protein
MSNMWVIHNLIFGDWASKWLEDGGGDVVAGVMIDLLWPKMFY